VVGDKKVACSNGSAERTRISAALLDLAVERGYGSVTLPMLLERADVDEATFHNHFVDPEDCLCSLLQSATEELMNRVLPAFSSQEGWRNQLRAVAYAMMRFFQEEPKRARVMAVEVLSAGERAQLVRDQGIEALVELIDQGRQELEDPNSRTRATAAAIAGAIYSQIWTEIEKGNFDTLLDPVPKWMYNVVLPYLGAEAALEELSIPPPKL
jgi:AcrR family transcriptional regulator